MEKVDGMGTEETKPRAGGPDKKIVYAIIAVVVVILAVVLVAKFGFGADLLNPAGGPGFTGPTPTVVVEMKKPRLCPIGTSGCGGTCVDLSTDSGNCGSCGRACNSTGFCNRAACYYPGGDPLCAGVVCQSDTVCCAGRCVRKDDLSSYSCIAG
jgi:hypothetical protein